MRFIGDSVTSVPLWVDKRKRILLVISRGRLMRKINALALSFALFFLFSCGSGNGTSTSPRSVDTTTPPNFKVAFIGDQGLGENSRAVLQLIKEEGADMVIHSGDFDYESNPDKWDQQINDVLGPGFPYFASVGNHDVRKWSGYQKKLKDRLDRVNGASCEGDLGVKSACTYKGLFFILSGAATMGSNHTAYIRDQLADNGSIWRICSWHKNQRLMQVGEKKDDVGWGPYEECRKAGAIIATAHNHAYARTHLMDDFETQSIASTSNTLRIEKGKTFVFVSGLGGRNFEDQNDELAANKWWAAVYTPEQGADFGALFCTFNEGGVENKAHCYFKDINGRIPDEFYIESDVR
jgi:hypothetical protein